MVYKKYIKRGGKVYGPYIYHSKRVDGKVISEYHGSKKIDYKKFFLIGVGVLFLFAVLYFAFYGHSQGTGNAILNLNANYKAGQPLSGKISLSLQQGEFLPANSQIVFDNNGTTTEYNLKDLVSDNTQNGTFYIKGSNISGSGEGYGLPGDKIIYPNVQFTLNILSSNQSQGSTNTTNNSTNIFNQTGNSTGNSSEPSFQGPKNETQNTTLGNTTGNGSLSITGNIISGIFSSIGNLFLGITPTGNTILQYENQIQGNVSMGKDFVYSLQQGQSVELNPLSVSSLGKQLPDNTVNLNVSGDKVIVTTNYSASESGFGENYLGNGQKQITIDLSNINYTPTAGNLNVSIIDNGSRIISLGTVLKVEGPVTANKTIGNVTNTSVKVNDLNFTSNAQQNSSGLTLEDKNILSNKFGSSPVKVSERTNGNFLIVRYELGIYWIEYTYNIAATNKTSLQSQMALDRVKWLKDLAKQISSESENPGSNFQAVGNVSVDFQG